MWPWFVLIPMWSLTAVLLYRNFLLLRLRRASSSSPTTFSEVFSGVSTKSSEEAGFHAPSTTVSMTHRALLASSVGVKERERRLRDSIDQNKKGDPVYRKQLILLFRARKGHEKEPWFGQSIQWIEKGVIEYNDNLLRGIDDTAEAWFRRALELTF